MSRRTRWIERPGTDGAITDLAAHQLPPRALAAGADAIMPNGLIRQRRGWAYDGTVADVAANLAGVYRNKFVLSNLTRTLTNDGTYIYIHNPSSAGSQVEAFPTAGVYLPRCTYNDQTMYCAQDGISPMQRYSGSSTISGAVPTTTTFTAGISTITATT